MDHLTMDELQIVEEALEFFVHSPKCDPHIDEWDHLPFYRSLKRIVQASSPSYKVHILACEDKRIAALKVQRKIKSLLDELPNQEGSCCT